MLAEASQMNAAIPVGVIGGGLFLYVLLKFCYTAGHRAGFLVGLRAASKSVEEIKKRLEDKGIFTASDRTTFVLLNLELLQKMWKGGGK